MPIALITGITGQDGSYLAEQLLGLGYEVHGTSRHAATAATHPNLALCAHRLKLHSLEISDVAGIQSLIRDFPFAEIYHLAAQTHVPRSFQDPLETCQANVMGTVALLEAIRAFRPQARLFHASSSLIFGQPETFPQDESTPFRPQNPYAASKAMATHMVTVYRNTYGLHAVNGICYNHESPRRGREFVTGKIAMAAARISQGSKEVLTLGNITAQRDWGDARRFVRGFQASLHTNRPQDFIFATGKLHSVEQVLRAAFDAVGLDWQDWVRMDPALVRPAEPTTLVGNPSQAADLLGWSDDTRLDDLIGEMTRSHLNRPTSHPT